jgi:hypothetical protein
VGGVDGVEHVLRDDGVGGLADVAVAVERAVFLPNSARWSSAARSLLADLTDLLGQGLDRSVQLGDIIVTGAAVIVVGVDLVAGGLAQVALGVAAPVDDLVVDEVFDVIEDVGQEVGDAGAAATTYDVPPLAPSFYLVVDLS